MGCLLVLLYYPSFLYFVSGEISKYICGDITRFFDLGIEKDMAIRL